jgi:hypothetical protein
MGPLTNAILRPIPGDYQPLVPTGVYLYGSRPRGIGEWQSLGVVKFALPPYSVELLDTCGPVDLIAPVRSRVFRITRLTKSHWDYVSA